jgi:hypothetical protein
MPWSITFDWRVLAPILVEQHVLRKPTFGESSLSFKFFWLAHEICLATTKKLKNIFKTKICTYLLIIANETRNIHALDSFKFVE